MRLERVRASLPQVRDVINVNRKMFKQGNELTEDEVLALFNVTVPAFDVMSAAEIRQTAQAFQLQKLGLQVKINKVLAKRGLYMKQHQNTKYQIQTVEGAAERAEMLAVTGAEKQRRAGVLNQGLVRHAGVIRTRISNAELRTEPDPDWRN